ncbi:MAG: TetR/AcrR family transcriptional regulator [Gemmatimonadetes bacterium]|nr:TetR/AcrR family transcriptional regulator [Gemmatimonadota bacterium]
MDNRTTLLECALELFADRGYDAVGVQEICTAAGVSKPTLYHYFGSKRGVLDALVAERWAPFVAELADAAAYDGDLPRTLERVVALSFDFAAREPVLCRMLLALWFASPGSEAVSAVAALHAERLQILEELFVWAARDHGNMRGRERTYAATLLGMIHTHIALALNHQIKLNDEVVHRAVHQFSHGIYS